MVSSFRCARCLNEYVRPRFECPNCKADLCFNCSSEAAGKCHVCKVALSPGPIKYEEA